MINRLKNHLPLAISISIVVCLMVTILGKFTYDSNKKINISEIEVKKIVWDSLSDGEKETVIESGVNWQDATVLITNFGNIPSHEIDREDSLFNRLYYWVNQNKKVIRVEIKITLDPLLGPIVKYIDPKSKAIIGYDLRM